MIISAAILAGGQARRMRGRAKGTLHVDRQVTIMERLIGQCCAAHMQDVIIVANHRTAYESFGVPIMPDLRRHAGPMAGIEAALTHYHDKADAVLFVPCDLPFISAGEFNGLKNRFLTTQTKAVYAVTQGSVWHPLCAIACCDLLSTVSDALDQGERKIRVVWQDVNAQPVPFQRDNAFFNVNTQTDVAKMQALLGSA